MVEKIKIFCDVQITLTFMFQCCFTGTQPRPFAYTLWLFSATAAVAVTDSAKASMLTIWPFREKVGQPRGLCHLTDCSYQEEEENVPLAGHKVSAFHHGGFSPVHA